MKQTLTREGAARLAGSYLRAVFDQPTMAREVEALLRGSPEALALLRKCRTRRATKEGQKP